MATPSTGRRHDSLPVAGAEYHTAYRTPALRWWHPLVALALLLAGWGVAVLTAAIGAVLYELVVGGATVEELGEGPQTPVLFLANNVGVALAVPVAVAIQWIVFCQRPGWLFSVEGRLRWHLLGELLLITGAVHVIVLVAWLITLGPPTGLDVRPETWFLLAVVLLTTPLQAAGEEVAFRGLATRAVGAWFADRRVGLGVSTTTTALVFTLVHGTADRWLVLFYLSLAVAASLLSWRAGGLEAAIALHVVVNLTTMVFVPFLGLEAADHPAQAELQAVAQVAGILLTSAAFVWHLRRAEITPWGPSRTPAAGAQA